MKKIALLLVFVSLCISIFSQELDEEQNKHLLALAVGYTFIPKATEIGGVKPTGVFVPTIGLDYFYKVSPKWEIGTMIDLELGEYFVFDKDLNREKAMVISLIGAYSLTQHINVFGGGGVELEKNYHLAIIRFGTEYAWKFENNWVLAPGFFYDFKEGYDTWSLSIAFGKEF